MTFAKASASRNHDYVKSSLDELRDSDDNLRVSRAFGQ